MLRRTLIWITLGIAAFCVGIASLLLRPPDVYEMLIGFTAGRLASVQWPLLAVAATLLMATKFWHRAETRGQRNTRRVLSVVGVILAVAVLTRDLRAFSRETVALSSNGVQLEATIYLPRGDAAGKRPGIVILHGSGPRKRDAYHAIARRFAERGLVVLNADKPGVGGSDGRYAGDNVGSSGIIEKRAVDARAALSYLASRAEVDTARIGVFAISQGGWIVPQLLAGETPARFGIIFSGVAVSSAEEGQWSEWAGEDADHFGFKPPPVPFEELDRRLREVGPGGFDPRSALSAVRFPVLWILGAWDSSAPTAASMRVIDSLQRSGVPITATVIPEANHGLFVVRGPRGSRYADYAPGVWNTVFGWTSRHRLTAAQ